MAEELSFARKASGLVRGLSMLDAFGVGFMNQGLTASIWYMTSLGVGIYFGGNVVIATIISLVLCGIGAPIVWGVLGGSMPRSGGEYIYNSRILHPIVGIGESFGNAFIMLMWIYVLSPWMADPGLTMMGGFMGWEGLSDFAGSTWGMFVIATLTSVGSFLIVVLGVRVFARIQKVLMVVGIGSGIVLLTALSLYSKADFVSAWNQLAAETGSLDYDQFLAAAAAEAGGAFPKTWNWYDTFGVMVAGSALFIEGYFITFVAGEVKRPDKTILLANLFAVVVPAVFMIWAGLALYRMVPFDFFAATQYVDNAGSDLGGAYKFAFSPNYIGLLAVVNGSKLLLFLAALSFLIFDFWWVVLSYLAFPRILFAWGLDRMGPRWFADVNPRFASPVKNFLLCLGLSTVLIALYCFWLTEKMQGLSVSAMEFLSVFGVTAVAALVFPYSRRARGIWESSPYRTWTILGVPVVSLGAVVYLLYIGIVVYFFFVAPTRIEGFTLSSFLLIAVTWLAGIAWYFIWKARNKAVGVDVTLTYGELPPE
jgi:amino acid transporter